MQLSNLSLLYIALCAFVAASILVVHANYADVQGGAWSAPFSLSQGMIDVIDAPADPLPSQTAYLQATRTTFTAIEM